jgi:uncharacterized protein YndB with AHSA1/START domain
MLKVIAIIVVVAIAIVLIAAATRPDTFTVQRSAEIKAPPERIFALIDDFRAWGQWSPYEKLDPAMQRSYSNPASGSGATYEWSGNAKAGAGSMEITASVPPSKIDLNLNFTKPFVAHNTVEFVFAPSGDNTHVTWTMSGPVPYMAKIMHMFFNMDKMVGGDFETGLANLKSIAEK